MDAEDSILETLLLTKQTRKERNKRAVVVDKWSAFLPSIPMIRVRILPMSTLLF